MTLQLLKTSILTISLVAFTSACDSSQIVNSEAPVPAAADEGEVLLQSILTQEQLATAANMAGDNSWAIAQEIHSTMSEEQRESVVTKVAEARRAKNHQHRTRRNDKKRTRSQRMPAELSDEQRELLIENREALREQMRKIRSDLEAGLISEEEAREMRQGIAKTRRDSVKAMLTDDQKERIRTTKENRMATMRESREKNTAAMVEALDLSSEQQATLKSQMEDLRETRGTTRGAAMEQKREIFDSVLTDEQKEIVAVHHLLTRKMRVEQRSQQQRRKGRARSTR